MKLKNLLHPILVRVVPFIGAGYSMIMGITSRFRIVGPPHLSTRAQLVGWKNGAIYCSWHSRFFYFSYLGRGSKITTMISPSKDGDFIARTIKKLRLNAVRGSSSSKGHEALYQMADLLKKNAIVLMIPDGPRGPRYCLKPGAIRLAQISGKPLIPVGFSSERGLFFPSWDLFLLPVPFDRSVMLVGEPIYVPAQLTNEEFEMKRKQLEETMRELCIEGDRLCKRDPEKEALYFLQKKKKKKTQS